MPKDVKARFGKSLGRRNYRTNPRSHAQEMQPIEAMHPKKCGLAHGSFVVPNQAMIQSIIRGFKSTIPNRDRTATIKARRLNPDMTAVSARELDDASSVTSAESPESSASLSARRSVVSRRDTSSDQSTADDSAATKAIEARLWNVQYQRDR